MAQAFLTNINLVDHGVLTRFLCVAPPSAAGTRFFKENSGLTRGFAKYDEQTQKLLKDCGFFDIQKNKQKKYIVALSSNAKKIWIEFSDHVEMLIAPNGELELIKGFANKLAEHAARLAGVITIFENKNCKEIDEVAMDQGIRLANFYAYELLRIMGLYRTPQSVMDAELIRKWLMVWKEDFVSVPDMQQFGPNTLRRNKNRIMTTIQVLEEHGWLIKCQGEQTIGSKKRKEVWKIVRVHEETL